MLLVGRSWQSIYKYGFNGYENDREIYGDNLLVDFGARVYDSRLSKFFSIDPYSNALTSISPYSFAANSPMILVDKDGEMPWLASGFIGGLVNVGIGYVAASITGEEYTWNDAGKDFVVGFAIGLGTALLAPMIAPAGKVITTGHKIIAGSLVSGAESALNNTVEQALEIKSGERERINGQEVLGSGLWGMLTGAAGAWGGSKVSKFMKSISNKNVSELTTVELIKYKKYTEKYLKESLEIKYGKKVSQGQLRKEVNKKVSEWKDLRIDEITSVEFIVTTTYKRAEELTFEIVNIVLDEQEE